MTKQCLYLSKIKNNKDGVEIKIPAQHTQLLKLFQIDGIRYIHKQFMQQNGAILNDESGLGKTVQTILYISAILISQPSINALIICNEKYINHWLYHLNKWCSLPASLYNDGSNKRIIVSTLDNSTEIINQKWGIVVIDAIDPKIVIKKVNKIVCKFKLWLWSYNLLNDLHSLFIIINWIKTNFDMRFKDFSDKFSTKDVDVMESWKRQQLLQIFCKSLLLRRTKDMVADELPLICAKQYSINFNKWKKEQESINKSSESGLGENNSMDYESDNDSTIIFIEDAIPEVVEIQSSQSNDFSTMSPSILDFSAMDEIRKVDDSLKRKGTKDATGLKIKHTKTTIENERIRNKNNIYEDDSSNLNSNVDDSAMKMQCEDDSVFVNDSDESEVLGDQRFQILDNILFGNGRK